MRRALAQAAFGLALALVGCDGAGDGDVGTDAEPPLACEPSGLSCDPATEYCHWAPGECSSPGTCRSLPTDCASEPDAEVCGCDGATYRNECEAHAAGESVDTLGPCP